MSEITKDLSLPGPIELTEAELDHVCGGRGNAVDGNGAVIGSGQPPSFIAPQNAGFIVVPGEGPDSRPLQPPR